MATIAQRLAAFMRPPVVRPFVEQGRPGTPVRGGLVASSERSSKWVGDQRYITISDMVTNTSIIAAGVHHFLNLIAHPQWTVVPADDGPEAREVADFVHEVLNDMGRTWASVVRRSATYRFFGFGIQEWTAKRRDDGRVGLKDLSPRPQSTIDRWIIDEKTGALLGAVQRPPQSGEMIPLARGKMLYLVEDALSDSPEGLGIFRQLAEPWERLKVYLDLEARTFERDLRGIPIGRVPYTLINQSIVEGRMTEAEGRALTQAMEDFVRLSIKQSDTGITLDSLPYDSEAADGRKVSAVPQWGLDLLQGSANGLAEIDRAIVRTQLEMARILTAEHLMMGESSGNRALSEDKSRNLYLVANAVLGEIVAAVNRDVLGPIWALNAFPDELMPECRAEDVAFKSAETVAKVLTDMASAGAVLAPNDPVIEDVRELLGVSPPPPPSPEMMGAVGDTAGVPDDGGQFNAADQSDSLEVSLPDDVIAAASDFAMEKAGTRRGRRGASSDHSTSGGRSGFAAPFNEAAYPRGRQGRFADKPGSDSQGEDLTREFRTKSKGTDDALNDQIVAASGVDLVVSDALRRDATEALAHVIADSRSIAALLRGMKVKFSALPGKHGMQKGKTLYISESSLRQHGPGFGSGIIRHELEHKRLTDQKVPSAQQEYRVRHTAGIWAAMRYSSMAKTNPRAASGFKLAAIEQGVRI